MSAISCRTGRDSQGRPGGTAAENTSGAERGRRIGFSHHFTQMVGWLPITTATRKFIFIWYSARRCVKLPDETTVHQQIHGAAMRLLDVLNRDPLARIPIKYKLPLGFIVLNLVIFAIGGYFMLHSVYAPLNEQILTRLQSESMAQATLFDKKLETLARRAEDFSSDGFIRTQTELLVTVQQGNNRQDGKAVGSRIAQALLDHLRHNKLPLEPNFYDLQVYGLQQSKLVGLRERSMIPDDIFAPDDRRPGTLQRFTRIVYLDGTQPRPLTAVVTPLLDIYRQKQIGYLVCVIDLGRVLWDLASTYRGAVRDRQMEKYLTLFDRHGNGLEIPWERLQHLGLEYEQWVDIANLSPTTVSPSGWPSQHIGRHLCRKGREMFGQSYPLQSTGWTTLIELSAEDAMQPIQVLEGKFLGLALLVALSTLVLLFFPIQYLIRPLGELQRMAFRIKEGDFSARNRIRTQDEIGNLAKTFNLMAEAIEERTRHLERVAADLQAREAELRNEHDRLNTVVTSMSDGLILLDPKGRVLLCNQAAEPLLQLLQQKQKPTEIRKCDAHDHTSPNCLQCLLSPEQITSCVLHVYDRIYEVNSTLLPGDNGRAGKVLLARDITERLLMQERQAHQEQLAVLGRTAAVVAHEMNNPLAAISMYNQMMASELPPDSAFREHVEVIRRNTQTCQRIIQDLLSYARISQPRVEEVDLHEILQHVVRFVQPFRKEKPFELRCEFEATRTQRLGDSTQLQQVFVNLLVNAIHALPDQQGRITLRTRNNDDRTQIVVEIHDNGSGIEPAIQHEIFEPFFTTKKKAGTGLGLSIARRTVNAHGGEVTLRHSRPGDTLFEVRLPLIQPSDKQESPEHAKYRALQTL